MDHTDGERTQPRWPWCAAGLLLYAAAVFAGVSVHRLWFPCRGYMLEGTVFATREVEEIAESCLRRMDEGFPLVYFAQDVGFSPSASVLGGLAMVLAASSWIVLLLGLHLRWTTTLIALVAAVSPTVFAVLNLSASVNPGGGHDAYISGWLWVSIEAVALAVFMVLTLTGSELGSSTLTGLAFVLWGATVFGFWHLIMDYSTMVAFNDYNWDTPPGTGWISVAVLIIAGSASMGFGRSTHRDRVVTSRTSTIVGGRRDEGQRVAKDLPGSQY